MNVFIPFLNLFMATAPTNNTNDVSQHSTGSKHRPNLFVHISMMLSLTDLVETKLNLTWSAKCLTVDNEITVKNNFIYMCHFITYIIYIHIYCEIIDDDFELLD